MKYMVMECHLSYAVVLDEDGRFLNVANRHYEVGQTVTDVVKMQDSLPVIKEKPKTHYKWIGSIAAMAACLVMIVTAVFQFGMNTPYGSVYMTINPEIRIDVNMNDVVIAVEGLNEDGKTLIEDYSYKKKDLDLVMEELIDLAIEMGYLHEGGQITLTLDADSNEWVVKKSDSLESHLNEHLTNKLSVTIDITNKKPETSGVTIPIGPDTNYGDTDYGETTTPSTNTTKPSEDGQTDYDDTDYGPNNDGVTDYDDTDYGPNNDGVTDYDDTDYGPNNDGVTDYDDTDYGPNNDGVTDYDDTDYGPNNDGVTNYGDSSGSGDSGYDDNDYGDDDNSGDSNYGDDGNSNYDDDDYDDDDDDDYDDDD